MDSSSSEEETKPDIKPRLGVCEVCNDSCAIYTCPACEVKTCSLVCSKIHKTELECSGVRNKVIFKPLKKLGDMDLHSDYSLLEQTGRDLETITKKYKQIKRISHKELERCNKLIQGALSRKIRLQLLPIKFSKHKLNKTHLNWKKDELYWMVEWVFPEAENLNIYEPRIFENDNLIDVVSKYTNKEKTTTNLQKKLSPYHEPGLEIKILLKAEKLPGNKFFMLKLNKTIRENLMHKIIVEYPVFYVIFAHNVDQYNFVHLVPKNKDNKNLLISTEEEIECVNCK